MTRVLRVPRADLSYGESFLINKKHSIAVFVDQHVVAGAHPGAVFRFFILVWIEPAWAERPPNLVYILG